jgi:hypothetical protein
MAIFSVGIDADGMVWLIHDGPPPKILDWSTPISSLAVDAERKRHEAVLATTTADTMDRIVEALAPPTSDSMPLIDAYDPPTESPCGSIPVYDTASGEPIGWTFKQSDPETEPVSKGS